MAKRKTKKVTRRRRRSTVSKVDFTSVVTTLAGAVGAKLVNKVLPATMNPKVVSGAKVLVGVALPIVAKQAKTKNLLSGIGTGMAVVGSMELLNQFGVVNGADDILEVQLNGNDIDVLNGDDDISVLNDDNDMSDIEDAEYIFTDDEADILESEM